MKQALLAGILVVVLTVSGCTLPLAGEKEKIPSEDLVIGLAKASVFYGQFKQYDKPDYNVTTERVRTDAVIKECRKRLPRRNYWAVNFCRPSTCLKILIDHNEEKPVCFRQVGWSGNYTLSYGTVIDKFTKAPIPNVSVWGEQTRWPSGHSLSTSIVKQKTDIYGFYIVDTFDSFLIYSNISSIFIFKDHYAPVVMTGKETELKPLKEGKSAIIMDLTKAQSGHSFSLCKIDGKCVDNFDMIALSEGEEGPGYRGYRRMFYLLGEAPSGKYSRLIVDNQTFNISTELDDKTLHHLNLTEILH